MKDLHAEFLVPGHEARFVVLQTSDLAGLKIRTVWRVFSQLRASVTGFLRLSSDGVNWTDFRRHSLQQGVHFLSPFVCPTGCLRLLVSVVGPDPIRGDVRLQEVPPQSPRGSWDEDPSANPESA